jgi:hypothetical protein
MRFILVLTSFICALVLPAAWGVEDGDGKPVSTYRVDRSKSLKTTKEEVTTAVRQIDHVAAALKVRLPSPTCKPEIQTGQDSPHGEERLTPEEKAAIFRYSENEFKSLNAELRHGKLSAESEKEILLINQGLAKLDPIPGTTYRGLVTRNPTHYLFYQSLKVGDVYFEPAYFSTSQSYQIATEHFTGTAKKAMLFEVHGLNGAPISALVGENRKKEREVLFKIKTYFRVIGKQSDRVILEEVPAGSDVTGAQAFFAAPDPASLLNPLEKNSKPRIQQSVESPF